MIIWQSVDLLLKVLLAGCCLYILYNVLFRGKKISIAGMKSGLYLITKRAWLLLLCMVLFFVASCVSHYFMEGHLPKLIMKFNYEEAARGQNPNGTRFNASDILSDRILNEVIARGSFDLTSEQLRNCLVLSSEFDNLPVVASADAELRIATEYTVECTPDIFRYDLDTSAMMDILADVYYEDFIANYSENDSILTLSFDDMENMDYMDLDDYFEMKAQKLGHYITNYSYMDSNYRLENSGETFTSLAEKINNFIDIELERYRSFILTNGLSQDKEKYGTRMDYENRLLQTDLEKQTAAYNVRLEAINMYDGQMARIVLVPTNDGDNEFYMSRTKIGVDYFADDADAALQNATNLQTQMDHNTYAKEQILASQADTSVYTQADNKIEALKQELLVLSENAKELSDAYIENRRNGYIQISQPEQTFFEQMGVTGSCVYAVLFTALLGGCMVLRHAKNETR